MKTCGIVVEYNPFHFGHLYQIKKIKEKLQVDVIIVVMSGNFVQRGEPALIDKWQRTNMALKNGVDLVIELPYIYATQSANTFAKAAVDILSIAQVDYLCFGSECANLANLQEIASTSINPDHLRENMRQGCSFPKAYSLLTSSMMPNDILAVCYLKALQHTNIQPFLIKRQGEAYHSLKNTEFASANAIRFALAKKENVSLPSPINKDKKLHFMQDYYQLLRYELLTNTRKTIQSYFLVNEGIEKHLINKAMQYNNYPDFIQSCINYRYTKARIQRTCLQILNHIQKEEINNLKPPHQLRILGFNTNGQRWLKAHKDLPIVVHFSKLNELYREIELRTTYTYAHIFQEQDIIDREIKGPIVIE